MECKKYEDGVAFQNRNRSWYQFHNATAKAVLWNERWYYHFFLDHCLTEGDRAKLQRNREVRSDFQGKYSDFLAGDLTIGYLRELWASKELTPTYDFIETLELAVAGRGTSDGIVMLFDGVFRSNDLATQVVDMSANEMSTGTLDNVLGNLLAKRVNKGPRRGVLSLVPPDQSFKIGGSPTLFYPPSFESNLSFRNARTCSDQMTMGIAASGGFWGASFKASANAAANRSSSLLALGGNVRSPYFAATLEETLVPAINDTSLYYYASFGLAAAYIDKIWVGSDSSAGSNKGAESTVDSKGDTTLDTTKVQSKSGLWYVSSFSGGVSYYASTGSTSREYSAAADGSASVFAFSANANASATDSRTSSAKTFGQLLLVDIDRKSIVCAPKADGGLKAAVSPDPAIAKQETPGTGNWNCPRTGEYKLRFDLKLDMKELPSFGDVSNALSSLEMRWRRDASVATGLFSTDVVLGNSANGSAVASAGSKGEVNLRHVVEIDHVPEYLCKKDYWRAAELSTKPDPMSASGSSVGNAVANSVSVRAVGSPWTIKDVHWAVMSGEGAQGSRAATKGYCSFSIEKVLQGSTVVDAESSICGSGYFLHRPGIAFRFVALSGESNVPSNLKPGFIEFATWAASPGVPHACIPRRVTAMPFSPGTSAMSLDQAQQPVLSWSMYVESSTRPDVDSVRVLSNSKGALTCSWQSFELVSRGNHGASDTYRVAEKSTEISVPVEVLMGGRATTTEPAGGGRSVVTIPLVARPSVSTRDRNTAYVQFARALTSMQVSAKAAKESGSLSGTPSGSMGCVLQLDKVNFELNWPEGTRFYTERPGAVELTARQTFHKLRAE